jgi:hypothetical protein
MASWLRKLFGGQEVPAAATDFPKGQSASAAEPAEDGLPLPATGNNISETAFAVLKQSTAAANQDKKAILDDLTGHNQTPTADGGPESFLLGTTPAGTGFESQAPTDAGILQTAGSMQGRGSEREGLNAEPADPFQMTYHQVRGFDPTPMGDPGLSGVQDAGGALPGDTEPLAVPEGDSGEGLLEPPAQDAESTILVDLRAGADLQAAPDGGDMGPVLDMDEADVDV